MSECAYTMIALTEGVFAEALREKVKLLVVGAGMVDARLPLNH